MSIHPKTKEAYNLLHEGTLAFARAEQAGMRIDVDYCKRKNTLLTKKINRLEKEILDSKLGKHWQHSTKSKINLNSNYQLAHFLYNVKKIKPAKTTTSGKGSVDDEALSGLNLPELNKLLEYRKLRKVRDTYLDAFMREQVNGYIHPFFNLHLVRTFRSSSDRPNFQNIPKRDKEAMQICRQAIYARPKHQLLSVDFSGIEVRIAAIYTQDEKLIYDTLHGDMHKDMAVELYMLDSLDKHHDGEKNLRQGGKNGFVFPQFYGDYYGNCAPNLLKWAEMATLKDGTPALVHLSNKGLVKLDKKGKVKNYDKFTDHVKHVEDMFWNERYKTYNKWKDSTWKRYQRTGYIDMFTGFRCSGIMNKKDVNNYPFQGTAFHCLLKTFIEVDKIQQKEKWDSRLVCQIHDELTLDTHPDELKYVAQTAERVSTKGLPEIWPWINIELEVEADVTGIDKSWAEKEFYEI